MSRRKAVALLVVAVVVLGTTALNYGVGDRYAYRQVDSLIRYAHVDVDLDCTMSSLSRDGYCAFTATPETMSRLVQSLDLVPYPQPLTEPSQNGDYLSMLYGKDPSVKLYVDRYKLQSSTVTQRVSGIFETQLYLQPSTGRG